MLFHFTKPYPPHPLNVVWRFFHRVEARATDPDWEAQARNLVAQFRADYAHYPDDASFQALLHDLRTASLLFRQWWDEHDVRGLPDGPRTMHHPTAGTLHFEHVTFQASLAPGLRVKVYTASPESAEKLAQMLAARRNADGAQPA
jgi:hypothetical protein